jgi:ABC-type sugar transport system substrate-binding protein
MGKYPTHTPIENRISSDPEDLKPAVEEMMEEGEVVLLVVRGKDDQAVVLINAETTTPREFGVIIGSLAAQAVGALVGKGYHVGSARSQVYSALDDCLEGSLQDLPFSPQETPIA